MLGIQQSTLLNMKQINIILILVLICTVNLLKANVPDYVEHHVKLGDPWNVTCHTPFKKPTSWVFVSALPHYFNHYLYEEGRLNVYMDGRYNLTISDDKHTSTLQINKTDENHAGQYACIPDRTTLEHRQFHKLILVEYSNIELIKYSNLNVTLNMNISFHGDKTYVPIFLCIFTYGTKEMSEIEKDSTGKLFIIYSFTKTYEPDEEVPSRCQILFKSGKPRIWNDTHLFIHPISSDQNEHYIVNGSSWNMSCSTSSSHPMKWTFQGVMSNESTVTLYKYWKINDNYSSRYNFNFVPQINTYTMIILHVDVNYAGTYTCTHQCSDHLIEKIVHLTVIDNLEIKLLYSPNLEEPTLTMHMTYVGPNTLQPQFSCLINKESYPMNKITFCGTNENYFESCFLSETFKYGAIIPDKCQIHFRTTLVKEHFLVVEQPFNNHKFLLFTSLLIAFVVVASVVIIALLIWNFKFRKFQKTQCAPSNEYFNYDNELLNKTTELGASTNTDVENKEQNLKDVKPFPHRGKSNLKNEKLEVALGVNKLKTHADKTKSKTKLETLIDVSTETIDTKEGIETSLDIINQDKKLPQTFTNIHLTDNSRTGENTLQKSMSKTHVMHRCLAPVSCVLNGEPGTACRYCLQVLLVGTGQSLVIFRYDWTRAVKR